MKNLRAHVSLDARLANLLQLTAGADVSIDDVDLTIKGVRAEVLLKVRLDNVAAIIDRTLTTIDRNPQILERLLQSVDNTVGTVGGVANTALQPGGVVDRTVGAVGQTLSNVTQPGGLLSQTVNTLGRPSSASWIARHNRRGTSTRRTVSARHGRQRHSLPCGPRETTPRPDHPPRVDTPAVTNLPLDPAGRSSTCASSPGGGAPRQHRAGTAAPKRERTVLRPEVGKKKSTSIQHLQRPLFFCNRAGGGACKGAEWRLFRPFAFALCRLPCYAFPAEARPLSSPPHLF